MGSHLTEMLGLVFKACHQVVEMKNEFDETFQALKHVDQRVSLLRRELDIVVDEIWTANDLLKQDIERRMEECEGFRDLQMRRFEAVHDKFSKLCTDVVQTEAMICALSKGSDTVMTLVTRISETGKKLTGCTTPESSKAETLFLKSMRQVCKYLEVVTYYLNRVRTGQQEVDEDGGRLDTDILNASIDEQVKSLFEFISQGQETIGEIDIERSLGVMKNEGSMFALSCGIFDPETLSNSSRRRRRQQTTSSSKNPLSQSGQVTLEEFENATRNSLKENSVLLMVFALIKSRNVLRGFLSMEHRNHLRPCLQSASKSIEKVLDSLVDTSGALCLSFLAQRFLELNDRSGEIIDAEGTLMSISGVLENVAENLIHGRMPSSEVIFDSGIDITSQKMPFRAKFRFIISLTHTMNLKQTLEEAKQVSHVLEHILQDVQIMQAKGHDVEFRRQEDQIEALDNLLGELYSQHAKQLDIIQQEMCASNNKVQAVLNDSSALISQILDWANRYTAETFDVRTFLGKETPVALFWVQYFGRETYEVSWTRFKEAYETNFGSLQNATATFYKTTLGDKKGKITCAKLKLILGSEGDLESTMKNMFMESEEKKRRDDIVYQQAFSMTSPRPSQLLVDGGSFIKKPRSTLAGIPGRTSMLLSRSPRNTERASFHQPRRISTAPSGIENMTNGFQQRIEIEEREPPVEQDGSDEEDKQQPQTDEADTVKNEDCEQASMVQEQQENLGKTIEPSTTEHVETKEQDENENDVEGLLTKDSEAFQFQSDDEHEEIFPHAVGKKKRRRKKKYRRHMVGHVISESMQHLRTIYGGLAIPNYKNNNHNNACTEATAKQPVRPDRDSMKSPGPRTLKLDEQQRES